MKKLIEDNYKSTVQRGKITPDTNHREFILKLQEELQEFIDASIFGMSNEPEELADIILVCFNYAKHFDIDIEQEIKKKVRYNFNRKD